MTSDRDPKQEHVLSKRFGQKYLTTCLSGRSASRLKRELLASTSGDDLRLLPSKSRYETFGLLARGIDFPSHWFMRPLDSPEAESRSPYRSWNLHGLPLGPLEPLAVYASDAYGRYQGKSHGPGCQHHGRLSNDDDFLQLGDWIEVERAADLESDSSWNGSRLCSNCGGFSLWRLDDDLIDYYRQTESLVEVDETLDHYDTQTVRPRWISADQRLTRDEWVRITQALEAASADLDTINHSDLLQPVTARRGKLQPLLRRARMAASSRD